MPFERRTGLALRCAAYGALAFLHLPVLLIFLYAFSADGNSYQFPPSGLTTHWFEVALTRTEAWDALWLSVKVAAYATLLALVLGAMAAGAIARGRFPGRDGVTFLFTLPISLPGIVMGISLLSAIRMADLEPGMLTLVVAHATFCLVVVYNNVVARLRRLAPSQIEASLDLGADPFQTIRHVVLPHMATALLAGGMLAFALSFDEIIVTTFAAGNDKTLPIWFLGELFRPRERPVTSVFAVIVMMVTALPILLSYYLTREGEEIGGQGK